MRVLLSVALAAALFAVHPASGAIKRFPLRVAARNIVPGPDMKIWVAAARSFERFGPTGSIDFVTPVPALSGDIGGAVAGPEGNMWITEPLADRLAVVAPDGQTREFGAGVTAGSRPAAIVVGLAAVC